MTQARYGTGGFVPAHQQPQEDAYDEDDSQYEYYYDEADMDNMNH